MRSFHYHDHPLGHCAEGIFVGEVGEQMNGYLGWVEVNTGLFSVVPDRAVGSEPLHTNFQRYEGPQGRSRAKTDQF